jgi:3-methyladenine DNA glycosylase Tag
VGIIAVSSFLQAVGGVNVHLATCPADDAASPDQR